MGSSDDTADSRRQRDRNVVTRTLEFACALLVMAMVVLLFTQVVGRYLFANPPVWTEELARAVFLYVTFIGGAIAVPRLAHLRIDGLLLKMPPNARSLLQLMLILLGVIFLGVVIYQSVILLGRLAHQPMTTVPLSKAWMFAAVPVGCTLMLAYELSRLVNEVRALVRRGEAVRNGTGSSGAGVGGRRAG